MEKTFLATRMNYGNPERTLTNDFHLKGHYCLCIDGLLEFFDIPWETEKIWVTVSDKYKRNWLKLKLDDGSDRPNFFKTAFVTFPKGKFLEHRQIYPYVARLLKKSGIKNNQNFYVKVEYEA